MNTLSRSVLRSFVAAAAALATAGAFAQAKPSCGLNNGKKAAGAPIPIGAIVGKTGPDDFSSPALAAAAYFKCVNENGGIHGRPIDYTFLDDQWNPEVAAQLASKLVRDRKVVAMVGSSSVVECGANAKTYLQEDIMVITGVGVSRECFNSKNHAPVNAGPRVSATAVAMYAAQKYKSRKMVCVVANIPGIGNWACEGAREWGKANGVDVETLAIDPVSLDATSTMLQAASKKPDSILLNLPKGIMIAMLAAAEQQGLATKIHFISSTPAYSADVPKTIGPVWNGNFDIHLEFLPLESAGADNLNWKATMDAYGSKSDPRDSFSQAGYLSARVATEALLKMDPAKIDRAGVSAALRKVSGFKSDILCKPYYVGEGTRHNANSSGPIAQISGNGFKQISVGCLTAADPELVDVRADEKTLGLN